MRGKRSQDKTQLLFKQGFLIEGCEQAAHNLLLDRVFGPTNDHGASNWHVFAAFDRTARCVAALETRALPVVFDEVRDILTGMRRVAVDPDWRGMGLFRDLMDRALPWCEAQTSHPTILFTEDPALYRRFGFVEVPQYAFVGPAPAAPAGGGSRRLDLNNETDAAITRHRLVTRAPVSNICALVEAPDLALENIRAHPELGISLCPGLDALVLHESDGDTLTIADVVADDIPTLAAILKALGLAPRRVKTLFPPDRLAWPAASPVEDDTGLMVRGTLPAAMRQPFMLPPTAEF